MNICGNTMYHFIKNYAIQYVFKMVPIRHFARRFFYLELKASYIKVNKLVIHTQFMPSGYNQW